MVMLWLWLWSALALAGPADVSLSAVDGTARPFAQWMQPDRSTLLVFGTLWCASCRAEQGEVEHWARANAATVRTLMVFSGSATKRVRREVEERGVDTDAVVVAVDERGELADAFEVSGTPTLVLLDRAGKSQVERHLSDLVVPKAALQEVEDAGQELGTSYHVVVLASDVPRAKADLADARDLVRKLERTFSEYDADSELSRVNARASTERIEVSDELAALLRGALHVAESTDGAFDPTWRPLADVWRHAEDVGAEPSAQALASAVEHVAWRSVSVDDNGVRFADPEVRIGLDGVAKGWIVDTVHRLLQERGYPYVLVNLGGDLRTSGPAPGGDKQPIHIADPFQPGAYVGTLRIEDAAVATSGNHLRGWNVGSERFGHILDPRTGRPAAFEGSVTAITVDAAMADALATALYVMGPEAGVRFAESIDGLEVVYAHRGGVTGTLEVDAPAVSSTPSPDPPAR